MDYKATCIETNKAFLLARDSGWSDESLTALAYAIRAETLALCNYLGRDDAPTRAPAGARLIQIKAQKELSI